MKKNILDQIINNFPQSIWWKDLNSTFLGCNDKLVTYAGLKSKNEIIGKTDYDIFSKKEADYFTKIDQEVITTGKPQLNFEECLQLPGQEKKWLSTSKIPYYNDENKIIGTIGWFNDITTFKQMEIKVNKNNKALFQYSFQLEQANKDLELANIDLEQFTYAASHDLKSPIRTIKNFATLLEKKDASKLDDQSLNYLDFIKTSANRMSALIDDVLGYASAGQKELITEFADLRDVVAKKMIDLKPFSQSKSAVVHLDLPSTKMNCFPHLLGLVFYNLIHNSVKFNISSSPIIHCGHIENDDFWIFSIKDNGIGIKPEFANQIFEPFKRLVGEEYEGSGIGLSICKRVVTLHKGEIWIEESQQGHTVIQFSVSKHLELN